ncbi:MAG: DinB family protein [Pseudodesulfovibrio sp.]|nr:DinB family protein [Pseudodesulfovibrio sp.]
MQELILSLAESLDEARKDMLSRLENLTETQQAFSPDPKSWSPLCIVEHCIRAERSFLANRPRPGNCNHVPPSFMNRIHQMGIHAILKWRIPVPIQSHAILPSGKPNLEDLASMWGDDMAWLREHIEKTPAKAMNLACFPHPIAGTLTLAQALTLDILHIRYHLPALEIRIMIARKI